MRVGAVQARRAMVRSLLSIYFGVGSWWFRGCIGSVCPDAGTAWDRRNSRLGVVLFMGKVRAAASAERALDCAGAGAGFGLLTLVGLLQCTVVVGWPLRPGGTHRFVVRGRRDAVSFARGASARRLSGAAADRGRRVPGMSDAVRGGCAAAAARGVPGLRGGRSGLFGSRGSGVAESGAVQRGADPESEAMTSRRLRGRGSRGRRSGRACAQIAWCGQGTPLVSGP